LRGVALRSFMPSIPSALVGGSVASNVLQRASAAEAN
jgi:hypothetical protein